MNYKYAFNVYIKDIYYLLIDNLFKQTHSRKYNQKYKV